jgi:Tetracyclin repressor-like, C-terminal domain
VHPQTGALRGDLLQLGHVISQQTCEQAGTIRAVLVEVSRHPALHDAMHQQFLDQRKALIQDVLRDAVLRGEIDAAAISDELWDLLPGYLIFRSIMPNRPLTEHTVEALVDEVIIPSLTRHRKANG